MQFSEMTAMLGLLLVVVNISVVSSIYTGGSRYPYMPAILSDAISSRSWEEVSYNYECILLQILEHTAGLKTLIQFS